jgi:hypothetical protein
LDLAARTMPSLLLKRVSARSRWPRRPFRVSRRTWVGVDFPLPLRRDAARPGLRPGLVQCRAQVHSRYWLQLVRPQPHVCLHRAHRLLRRQRVIPHHLLLPLLALGSVPAIGAQTASI